MDLFSLWFLNSLLRGMSLWLRSLCYVIALNFLVGFSVASWGLETLQSYPVYYL